MAFVLARPGFPEKCPGELGGLRHTVGGGQGGGRLTAWKGQMSIKVTLLRPILMKIKAMLHIP